MKIKAFFLGVAALLLALVMYFIFVADKIICVFAIGPRVGFKVWLHNPNVKALKQPGAIDHNLQLVSLIRVVLVLTLLAAYSWIW